MSSLVFQVIMTVLLSLCVVALTGAGIYGLTRSQDSRGDRIGGAAVCLAIIFVLSLSIAYVWL